MSFKNRQYSPIYLASISSESTWLSAQTGLGQWDAKSVDENCIGRETGANA